MSALLTIPTLRCVLFLGAGVLVGESANSLPDGMETWVKELGDERYAVRETAHREIWKHGSAALPMLQQLAAGKGDPERMLRARDLIRKIVFEITPDSDPKLVEWIEKYESASDSEKESILGKMKGKRAWLTMLRLFAGEKDENTRAKLRSVIDGVAVRAAREKLATGDVSSARTALELAPADAGSLLSLAVFHRNQGTWDEVWNKLGEKERNGPWGLALLRAADRISEARVVAAESGDVRLAAWFAALEGDPLNFMDVFDADMDEMEMEYVKLAKRRWRGEELRAADFERIERRVNGRDKSSRTAAIQSLFLLAKPSLAEPAFMKDSPLAAFLHFEQLEYVPKALASLGLDAEKPDYGSWFRTKFGKYKKDDIEDQHGVDQVGAELVVMAAFLEAKGMGDVLWDAFAESVLVYAKEEEMEFLNLMSLLFGGRGSLSGAPTFSARLSEKWAGENEGRWSEVRNCAFGDEEDVRVWWDWLGRQNPGMSFAERFRAQMSIYRLGSDPLDVRGQWMQRALETAQEDPEWLKRILQLAMETEDTELYLKAEALTKQETRDQTFWGVRISYLSAAERWGDVADAIIRHLELHKKGGLAFAPEVHAYAYLASALRLAGRSDEAAAHDAMAEALYLGEPTFALRIGNGYAFGRDYKRALMWWKRACMESDLESPEFAKCLDTLADAWLQQGEWLRAASLYECMARLHMNSDFQRDNPLIYTRYRLHADTTRAISRIKTHREESIAALERCHEAFLTDGSLADVFFPSLKRAGLLQEHNRLFDKTWAHFREVIGKYPDADNTRNTAAWISSRAVRKLDEGMADIKAALARRPNQAAYLDTRAELHFAMGNREAAVEWSSKAMMAKPDDPIIRRQHARFLFDPLPK
jgi:tetratricopeptide (TPR) repeat protein